MAHSSELPLITALPRAWIAFGRAPWQHVGLSALALLSSIGFALVGQDLRAIEDALLQRIGDVCVLCSLLVPIGPVLALLKLADRMLPEPPATSSAKQRKPRGWLLRQAITLMVIELLVLAGCQLLKTLVAENMAKLLLQMLTVETMRLFVSTGCEAMPTVTLQF